MASHFAPKHARSSDQDLWQLDVPADAGPVLPGMQYLGDNGSHRHHHHRHRHHRRHRARFVATVVGIVLAVILAAVGTAGALLYRSAMTVRERASSVMAQASVLAEALESGDADSLATAVSSMVANVEAINEEVNGPLWNLATLVPVVGEDISSVQTLGSTAYTLVNEALVPVAESLSGVSLSSLLQDGEINVELVSTLSDTVSDAAPVIQSCVETVTSLPEAHISQLSELLEEVQEPLTELQEMVDLAEPVLEALPQMLGADGQTRTYLIIAQNNAEARSTGGLPGSWVTITITDGVMTLGESTTLVNKSGFDVEVSEEERINLGMTIGTNAAQMTFTPNFVRVGELAQGYWEQAGYGTVDGVISVDPVFLQRLLGLTGGFTTSDGTVIDGTTAAEELLSGTYWKFGNDGSAQDEYFSAVAALAFQNILDNLGSAELSDLLDVISESAEDGRLLAWMADEEEEEIMALCGLAGEMGDDPTTPVLGVYINDSTVSKISWYAAVGTTIGEGVENEDGTTTYEVTTTITNTITEEEAEAAPTYVTGSASDKRDTSDMLAYVYFWAPAGGTVSDFVVSDGGTVYEGSTGAEATIYGLQLRYFYIHAMAGETVTISYKVTVSAEATEDLTLRTTPLAQESLMLN